MNKIKELRVLRDKTQKEIADELKISQQSYARYECLDIYPPGTILKHLADYYNVTVDYILGRPKNEDLVASDVRMLAKDMNSFKHQEPDEFEKLKKIILIFMQKPDVSYA
ncbi:MAG: helix-turn-helix domain-containing protein [Firmicutes bacterium]|nr:helix-turn-helix domain-containing protein [Bacillota bacterium]